MLDIADNIEDRCMWFGCGRARWNLVHLVVSEPENGDNHEFRELSK